MKKTPNLLYQSSMLLSPVSVFLAVVTIWEMPTSSSPFPASDSVYLTEASLWASVYNPFSYNLGVLFAYPLVIFRLSTARDVVMTSIGLHLLLSRSQSRLPCFGKHLLLVSVSLRLEVVT